LNSQVCVDVSLALKLVLVEADSAAAHQLWSAWIDAGVEVVAPPLFAFEGTSVICSKAYRGLIPPEEADLMFRALHLLGVRLLYPEGLHQRAWELARRFHRPQAYDSHYLALAEMLGIELWTADDHLYNAVKDALPWIRQLGDAPRG
jgi:predicted nucleic acid-binding protein